MRITIVSYGIAIIIFSALVNYVVHAGVVNCNSMAGLVSTYTSQDFATGCHTLMNIQIGTIVAGIVGAGISICGIIKKPKTV